MEVEDEDLEKADKSLREALKNTPRGEKLRVIVTLDDRNSGSESNKEFKSEISPADFESRTDYRKALIEQRKSWLNDKLAEVRERLSAESLQIRGGEISKVIVVDGDVQNIARSLSIPGVKKMVLDRQIALPDINKVDKSNSADTKKD